MQTDLYLGLEERDESSDSSSDAILAVEMNENQTSSFKRTYFKNYINRFNENAIYVRQLLPSIRASRSQFDLAEDYSYLLSLLFQRLFHRHRSIVAPHSSNSSRQKVSVKKLKDVTDLHIGVKFRRRNRRMLRSYRSVQSLPVANTEGLHGQEVSCHFIYAVHVQN
ncbi:uncharacterized protein LOC130753319 [Actinidia eriantha]|uniref:uncharacterized protein LOC130753319 n=1 Tax=Actinidia eriantha TaxID=165200 RepID=UPI00258422BE|nr:uncharacterized protein LOC130753319 [Actinidia eriantha]